MAKYLNEVQRRNNDKIAQMRRRASYEGRVSEVARRNFMMPAYGGKKNEQKEGYHKND